ncbi:MAG: agmatine deiminase [Butyrivibrio sp.]|nr:agmatine deiminase [Butyrivibrio sp.]
MDGYCMPAEYEPHEGTIMIWPVRPGSWGKDPSKAQEAFKNIFREITKSEKLFLLADKDHYFEAAKCVRDLERACVLEIPSNDSWARDVAPTYVKNDLGDVRAINWEFNAWGGTVDGLYADWSLDNKVPENISNLMGTDMYDASPFVLEGGSIHTDGEGTAMVTESCLLSKGRNPELSKRQIEDRLKEYLGVTKVLWLPRGIYMDETNEHVDNVCAFVGKGQVVLATTDNKEDPQYELSKADLEYLENETDAKGRKLIVYKLPIPDHPVLVTKEDVSSFVFEEGEDVRQEGERLAASYVNFYFTNDEVLVPAFGKANEESDNRAAEILQGICKTRKVVQIPARQILLGGGNIHCITQQVPLSKPFFKKNMMRFE